MDQDLVDLISVWIGAEHALERCDELLARLRSDETFQQAFVEQISMLGMLKVFRSSEPRWLSLQHELGWEPIERVTDERFEERFMHRLEGIVPRRSGILRRHGLLVASVVLLGMGVLAYGWHRSRVTIQTEAPQPVMEVARGSAIALASRFESAQWNVGAKSNPAEGTILSPGRLQIFSGRVVVSFFSGVVLTLEGPADVDVLAINRVFCRFGKLRAQVPAGAEGFLISSPRSAVVDMGTELGLNVEAGGKARIMVFEGKAEAAVLDASGSPVHTQIVGQSHAFDIDPVANHIVETSARQGFAEPPESGVAPLLLDRAYAQSVLLSGPRAYWRFESLVDGQLANEVAGGTPLRAHGPISLSEGAPGSRCVVFQPGSNDQFLSLDVLWELARVPGHAVEFWFQAENFRHASLVGLYPPDGPPPTKQTSRAVHIFLVEQTATDRESLNKPGCVRYLHRWPVDFGAGDNLFSAGFYRPRRWHHVVAQKNGDRMELYFDGEPCQSTNVQLDHPTIPCRLVVGRRTTTNTHVARQFVGRLDELAIYDRPLALNEIKRHYELAIPISSE